MQTPSQPKLGRLLGALAICGAVGCSVGTRTVELTPVIASLEPESVPPRRAVAVQVLDRRPLDQHSSVGIVRSPSEVETAFVVSRPAPPIWLRESLTEQLQSLGFEVVKPPTTRKHVLLRAELNSCYTSGYWRPVAELKVKLKVSQAGRVLHERSYETEGHSKFIRAAATAAFHQSLDDAMIAFLETAIPEATRAMQRSP